MIHCIKNDYGSLDEGAEVGPAAWPHFDLIFLHSGGLELSLGRKKVMLDEGQAVLIYPGTHFQGPATTPTTKISVHHFSLGNKKCLPKTLASLPEQTNGYKKYTPCETAILEQDIERIVTLTHEDDAPAGDETRSLMMLLIICQLQLLEKQKKPKQIISPEIQNLTAWLKENLAEEVSLDCMASQAHLSTSHFRALFKKQIGTSPGNYLLNLRTKEATRLLRNTSTPIKEIAQLTGYKDLTCFYHAFKTLHKTTPKAYRDQHLPMG